MSPIIITDKEEFQEIIRNSVREVLKAEKQPHPQKEEKKYLTVTEAAEYTGNAVPTMYALSAARKITSYKPNKNLLFLKVDLDKYILQGRRKSIQEIEEDIERRENNG